MAFLLRLWQEGDNCPWRAMVEDPHTGERQGFPDLPALFDFLEAQTTDGQALSTGINADSE